MSSMLKSLVPEHYRKAIVASRAALREKSFWSGVYESFSDVPAVGSGFEGAEWAEECAHGILEQVHGLETEPLTTSWRYHHHEILSVVIGAAYPTNQPLRLLDFGGGMAPDHIHLRACLAEPGRVEHYVLESKGFIERASNVLSQVIGEDSVKWVSNLGDVPKPLDIVHLNAVLQYIEDWKGLLRELSTFHARFLLFVRLPLGTFQTYASGQMNHPPSVIPCWFFNDPEFKCTVEGLGYNLKFQTIHDRTYNQSNFPPEWRCPRRCTLLFERS